MQQRQKQGSDVPTLAALILKIEMIQRLAWPCARMTPIFMKHYIKKKKKVVMKRRFEPSPDFLRLNSKGVQHLTLLSLHLTWTHKF